MTELEKKLYEALRALDEHVAAVGQYADKDELARASRRALQAFRAKRREEQEQESVRLFHPRIRTFGED